jgi:hypothetical protein
VKVVARAAHVTSHEGVVMVAVPDTFRGLAPRSEGDSVGLGHSSKVEDGTVVCTVAGLRVGKAVEGVRVGVAENGLGVKGNVGPEEGNGKVGAGVNGERVGARIDAEGRKVEASPPGLLVGWWLVV